MKKICLVTGSSGLIGSEVCIHFHNQGYAVHSIDNNQRAVFFGPQADTRRNQQRLEKTLSQFQHHELDIRDRDKIRDLLKTLRPQIIVHAAAQPSHDRAAAIPYDDFDVNAAGTLNLLEAARQACPETPFIHMSTNKVYGDRPNTIPLQEFPLRWDFADPQYAKGIDEMFSIDQSKHSLFGASKLAADMLVQEYGRYFDMPTCCLRGGCLTGPNHSGVELHGFLSYLVKCNLEKRVYRIYGYKGKQVRDNLHSVDVAAFMLAFADNPRCGEVYNLGGGKENSCSILEAFQMSALHTGVDPQYVYVDTNRLGDHICYYSDLTKIKQHYPGWSVTKPLDEIIAEIVVSWRARLQLA